MAEIEQHVSSADLLGESSTDKYMRMPCSMWFRVWVSIWCFRTLSCRYVFDAAHVGNPDEMSLGMFVSYMLQPDGNMYKKDARNMDRDTC
jgi:hypothetical protein